VRCAGDAWRLPVLARVFGLLLIAVLGCENVSLSYDAVRAQNVERLRRVRVGMAKLEVLDVMGTETVLVCHGAYTPCDARYAVMLPNPYRIEVTQTVAGGVVEVVYYYTEMTKADDAITDDELTPLVFKDEELIGWGWTFVQDAAARYEVELRSR